MPNTHKNKVVYNGIVLIDLTEDTVTPSTLMQGYTAHDKSGALITGTATGGGTEAGTVTQDAQGYLVLDDEAPSGRVTVEALSVTQNGTYTAPTGKAYSPVTVSVGNSYTASDEGKVVSNGALVAQTARASSITANGTYDTTTNNSVTVNVSGGGGGDTGNRSDPIRFFDYDGTLVASYSSVPASLPDVPTHTGLTNGVWNHTLSQVTTQFNAMGTCDVGANYDTVSGATEIDIKLQDGRLHPYLSLAVNGTVSVDWGDGSTPDTATGTSLATRLSSIHHEYAAAGSYTIKVTLTSGTGYSLYCTSTYMLLNNNNSTSIANQVYSSCVQAVRIGEDCAIGSSAFYNCYSLASVSIPSTVTSIGNSSPFAYCYSLESISIPSTVTSIGASAFNNCCGMAEYHFLATTPPTLANVNAFTSIQSDCVIYVPSSKLDDYKTATNWSNYASYMVGE